LKGSFRTKLRQLWVPSEFRLPEPEFTKEQIDLLEELIQMITPNLSSAENATKDGQLRMATFLVDLGTGVWKIRRKIEGLSRMPKEIRDALYSLESMWISMSDGGVEIIDHIGTIPSQREATVVETREIPGLAREQVVDAIKPTILLRGEIVQVGEVILGKPASSVDTITYRTDISEPEPQDETDELPAQVHEVETLTFAPPLKIWGSDDDEASPPTEGDSPILSPQTEDAGGIAPKEEDSAIRDETPETGGGMRLDSETAEPIEAEEPQYPALETPAEDGNSPEEAEIEEPEKTQPEKPRRRGRPPKTAKQDAPEQTPEAKENDEASVKRKKTRAAATVVKKTRQGRASSRAKITPKQSGEEEA
jgi:hypothetical protein